MCFYHCEMANIFIISIFRIGNAVQVQIRPNARREKNRVLRDDNPKERQFFYVMGVYLHF